MGHYNRGFLGFFLQIVGCLQFNKSNNAHSKLTYKKTNKNKMKNANKSTSENFFQLPILMKLYLFVHCPGSTAAC